MAVFSGSRLRWTPRLLALDAVIPAEECVLVGGSVSRTGAERERVSRDMSEDEGTTIYPRGNLRNALFDLGVVVEP